MPSYTFKWPHDAEEVYVTGTFDNWTKSERLERVGEVFQKTVSLSGEEKVLYKFVVNGDWTTDHTAPQEKDHEGNENNVLLPEQMDKLEESAQAAAINNLVPESTTAQLAGAVPVEDKKEEKQEEKTEETAEQSADPSSGAGILSSAAPDATTAQLAAAVPLEDKQDATVSPPGSFPETPAAELEKEIKVDTLPAAEGAINPIKLNPGESVPKDLRAEAADKHVTLDKESYEKSDRIPGLETTLPHVTGNLIPESSLPIVAGGSEDVTINTVAADSTTAALAGQVPKETNDEPKVPEIVKESQEKAHADPEASAHQEEVKEKAVVESELLDKVSEAPATSEGTAGKGTEKSETDKSPAETALAAATTAGEVALGAAITAAGAAIPIVSSAAHKASDAAADIASKATAVASDASTTVPAVVKANLPGAGQAEAAEKQKAAIDSISPEVPAEVKKSLQEAGESPEAAVNTAAVEEKKEYEAELLKKVEPAQAADESKATEEAAPEVIEPPQPAETIEAVDAGKPAEEAKGTSDLKLTDDIAAAVNATVVDPTAKPAEETKAVDTAKPVEAAAAATSVPAAETAAAEPTTTTTAATPAKATTKTETAHPVTNGSAAATAGAAGATAGSTTTSTTDKAATSEKKKKNRFSRFIEKLKSKKNTA